jgi:hypothetical protein
MSDIGTKNNPNLVLGASLCKGNVPDRLSKETIAGSKNKRIFAFAMRANPPIHPDESGEGRAKQRVEHKVAANAAGVPYTTKQEADNIRRLKAVIKEHEKTGNVEAVKQAKDELASDKVIRDGFTKMGGARETRRWTLSAAKPNLP